MPDLFGGGGEGGFFGGRVSTTLLRAEILTGVTREHRAAFRQVVAAHAEPTQRAMRRVKGPGSTLDAAGLAARGVVDPCCRTIRIAYEDVEDPSSSGVDACAFSHYSSSSQPELANAEVHSQ